MASLLCSACRIQTVVEREAGCRQRLWTSLRIAVARSSWSVDVTAVLDPVD